MKIRGNTVGTPIKPEKVAEKSGIDNVFIGDENTTYAELNSAFNAGKVCFVRRSYGGLGVRLWVVYRSAGPDVLLYSIDNNGHIYTAKLDMSGNFTVTTVETVDKAYVDEAVGDIDAALDELHTYAQALINGGGA